MSGVLMCQCRGVFGVVGVARAKKANDVVFLTAKGRFLDNEDPSGIEVGGHIVPNIYSALALDHTDSVFGRVSRPIWSKPKAKVNDLSPDCKGRYQSCCRGVLITRRLSRRSVNRHVVLWPVPEIGSEIARSDSQIGFEGSRLQTQQLSHVISGKGPYIESPGSNCWASPTLTLPTLWSGPPDDLDILRFGIQRERHLKGIERSAPPGSSGLPCRGRSWATCRSGGYTRIWSATTSSGLCTN